MDNMGNDMLIGGNNFAEFLILLLLIGQGGGGLFGNSNDKSSISNEFQMTQGKLDNITASTNTGFANTQMSFAAAAQQLSKCCCDTQLLIEQRSNDTNRHIDGVLFDVTTQGTANTQRVVDRVDRLEDSLREQRIRELETQLAACNTRDTVGATIAPIAAALASIQAQMNCGVKAVQYTPSLPVATPAAYAPYPVMPFGGYSQGGCCNGFPGYGYNQ